ncbi:hypothetical protein MIR68_010063 [Amoeboaphelidium protococcarum]|nr:hypothetical protein MIR68_010063 [Amoeboaphelidium protococcarum]
MVTQRKSLIAIFSVVLVIIVVYSLKLLPDVGRSFKYLRRFGYYNLYKKNGSIPGALHYSKLPQATAAVVYLIAHHEEDNFRKSVLMTLDNSQIQMTTKIYEFEAKGCKLIYQKVNFTFPSHYDQKSEIAVNFAYPGYNFMIHLWFMDIFQTDRIKDLEYYWRLDTDSFIHNKVYADPFRFMKYKGIKYGYRDDNRRDNNFVTVGIPDAVDKWLDGHVLARNLSRQNDMELPAVDEREGYWPLMMYTNFEIAHIPTFQNKAKNEKVQLQDGSIMQTADRNKQIVEFADYIDRTNRIFTHRWGDAPLRYYQLKMLFSWEKEVWKFCAVDYEHAHHNKRFEPCVDDIALQSIIWIDV